VLSGTGSNQTVKKIKSNQTAGAKEDENNPNEPPESSEQTTIT